MIDDNIVKMLYVEKHKIRYNLKKLNLDNSFKKTMTQRTRMKKEIVDDCVQRNINEYSDKYGQ